MAFIGNNSTGYWGKHSGRHITDPTNLIQGRLDAAETLRQEKAAFDKLVADQQAIVDAEDENTILLDGLELDTPTQQLPGNFDQQTTATAKAKKASKATNTKTKTGKKK